VDFIIKIVTSEMLHDYCQIPISFYGNSIFEIDTPDVGFGGYILNEKPVNSFYKDFDLFDSPMSWMENFDLSNWRFYIVYLGEIPIGAATLVMNSNEIRMLEGKKDLACLWDIRIQPDYRSKGVGSALFKQIAKDAKEFGKAWLKIETQNNNVSANKFYKSQGCHLAQVHLHAYYDVPECKDEAMLIWYLDLKKRA